MLEWTRGRRAPLDTQANTNQVSRQSTATEGQGAGRHDTIRQRVAKTLAPKGWQLRHGNDGLLGWVERLLGVGRMGRVIEALLRLGRKEEA